MFEISGSLIIFATDLETFKMSRLIHFTLLIVFLNAALFNAFDGDFLIRHQSSFCSSVDPTVTHSFPSTGIIHVIFQLFSESTLPVSEDDPMDDDPDVYRRVGHREIIPVFGAAKLVSISIILNDDGEETDQSPISSLNESRTIIFGHIREHLHRFHMF